MQTVYLETTVPSYLVARPSRDLIVAAHQQITREWWDGARRRYDLVISDAVLEEISVGDPAVAADRLKAVAGMRVLTSNDEVRELAKVYGKSLGLPDRARVDLTHLSFAVVAEVDYLVTWNCAHIANGSVIRRLIKVNESIGRTTPLIITPTELLDPM
jgi:hypothetical protein